MSRGERCREVTEIVRSADAGDQTLSESDEKRVNAYWLENKRCLEGMEMVQCFYTKEQTLTEADMTQFSERR